MSRGSTSKIISTTNGAAYIVAMDTLERMPVQFYPGKMGWRRTSNENEIDIVGRNLPDHHYTGGAKSMSLTLDFYSTVQGRDDVIDKVRWLESLTYNSGPGTRTARIKLIFGQLFRDEVWAVRQVRPNFTLFEKDTFMPLQATVELRLRQEPRSGDVTREQVEGSKRHIEQGGV